MKMLLTSGGVSNPSIHEALLDLLGKPISECTALCITTASYPLKQGALRAREFIAGLSSTPMVEFDWKSVGALELTAFPSLSPDIWQSWVRETDALLVNGGDTLFLHHWMRESGLADLLPSLDNLVYVGLSAGSMVMSPRIGEEFVGWKQPSGTDETLGLVDFAMFPHLNHPDLPDNIMPTAEKWSAKLSIPTYAIDDDTAFRVADGQVEVISEGTWRKF